MAICRTEKHVEIAFIELEYLLADTLFDAEGQSADEEYRRVMGYYRAAAKALEVCLEIIEQAKAQKNKALVA